LIEELIQSVAFAIFCTMY